MARTHLSELPLFVSANLTSISQAEKVVVAGCRICQCVYVHTCTHRFVRCCLVFDLKVEACI